MLDMIAQRISGTSACDQNAGPSFIVPSPIATTFKARLKAAMKTIQQSSQSGPKRPCVALAAKLDAKLDAKSNAQESSKGINLSFFKKLKLDLFLNFLHFSLFQWARTQSKPKKLTTLMQDQL